MVPPPVVNGMGAEYGKFTKAELSALPPGAVLP